MGIAIQKMFDGIAGRYDFLNRFLSAGRDRVWRRMAAERLAGRGASRVLDLCGGTGDFWHSWIEAERRGTGGGGAAGRSLGVIADFSLPMLQEARRKFVAGAPGGG